VDVGQNPKSEILRGCKGFVPAEGLGVSPNSLFISPKIGGSGVEALKLGHLIEKGTEHEADPSCCNGPVMLTYFSADTAVVITREGRHHYDSE